MKKKILSIVLMGSMVLSLVACTGSSEAPAETATEAVSAQESAEGASEELVGLANPWRECTEEEAYQFSPNGFSAPEGATNVKWSLMEVKDNTTLPGTMVQLTFDRDNYTCVAREQPVAGEEIVDISGMYYDWTVESDGILQNWAGGQMPCKSMRYVGDDKYVDVCLWFDIETGYAYSLSAEASDLDGFDIEALAAEIYDPAKQIGANMPDDYESAYLDEYSNAFIKSAAEESAPSIDISGCDTFTQIVDQKLSEGMGYANVSLLNGDVLLVSSGTYDNLDGKFAAIDAAVFEYKDGVPYELGKICSGGTAYPISVKDGYLYTGSNHWICKYVVGDDKLYLMEKAAVAYDSEGNGTYFYESDDSGDYTSVSSEDAEKIFDQLLDEMMNGEIVDFSTVGK